MIAVDTNVLVRILVEDKGQPKQTKQARDLAMRAKHLFVPQTVLVELSWVLKTAYRFKREVIADVIEKSILDNAAFEIEDEKIIFDALALYRKYNCDFSDVLILLAAHESGHKPLVTFDKKLAKLPGVKGV